MPRQLTRREDDVVLILDDHDTPWSMSGQGNEIKYGILFGILLLGFLVILGSWLHARQRLKGGLPPLAYHRWIVPRSQRARYEPRLRDQPEHNFSFYRQNHDGYDMHAVPPPVYSPHFQQPPAYSGGDPSPPPPPPPPPPAAKINPFRDPQPDGEGSGGSGSSMPQVHYPPLPAGYPPPPRYS